MLQIDKLSIKYKNTEKSVFEDVTFCVEKGEVVVLLGPSGCGKTTLLNHVAGLLSENEVEASGKIEMKNEKDMTKIHMVFQNPTLLPWRKVWGNVALGIEVSEKEKERVKKKVDEAIEMVGLRGYEQYYPHQLSVGMRQRVNFARALVCEPELVLLDEPFSALDVNRKKSLQKKFLEIIANRNMTAIFVTHSIEEALEVGDKIFVFFDGKKVKRGFYANKFKKMDKKDLYINAEEYLDAI